MKLLENIATYTLSSTMSKLAPFLILPLITAYLSPEEMGIFSVYATIVAITTPIIFSGVHFYFSVEFYKLTDKQRSILVSNISTLPLLVFFLVLAIFVFFIAFKETYFELPRIWILTIPIVVLLTFPTHFLLTVFRLEDRPLSYALLESSNAIFHALLALIFVVLLNLNIEGRISAHIGATTLIFSISLWPYLRKYKIRFPPIPTDAKKCLKFSMGCIPFEICHHLSRLIDRIFLVYFVGIGSAGLYAISSQLASIAQLITVAFSLAWQPYVFKILSSENQRDRSKLTKLSLWSIIIFGVISIILYFAISLIYQYLIDKNYYSGIKHLPWLLVGHFFSFLQVLGSHFLFFRKKMKELAVISVFSLCVLILCNLYLIPKYGDIGAAYSFAIFMFFSSTCCLIFAYHIEKAHTPTQHFRNI